ncbi:hypothetical protein CFE70_006364 [Pyrenophora teres f. teres 0-1]
MKVFVSLGAFVAAVSAQIDTFEPADFNVTKALILNGVNVSAIPELAGLAKQSALSGCSIAASAQFEVSSLVLISRLTQCPFAVKGGGHAAFAGASSIADGITVSMERMNHVVVSKDKKYANVGPGNRWVDVYKTVEKSGVNVVGGRMAPVGVPGLILGGGISFFSNKRGWACDNIAAYEVVTACGLVVTATPQDYPDLYWALRGGGNNFGIVTNFKMDAFPLGKMWGGQRIFTENNFPAVLDAVYKFATVGSSKDTDAAEIVSFSNLPSLGNIAIVQTHYAQPVANASVFADLNAITPVVDDTSISYLSDLTIKMNGGSPNDTLGKLQTQWDATFHVDRELFTFLVDTFYALLPDVQNLEGAFPVISIQAITEGQLKGMQKNGGNALGMTLGNGPIFIMNMSASFSNAADEAAFLKFFSTIIKKVKAEAVRGGVDNEYIYMNYASQFMDPIATYGAANQQKLVAISKKYDPTQLFQNLLPGHFKLAKGAPNPNMP